MPNGKDYVLFYLKMLLESLSHEGELRFSETIPYNEDMLSTITDTNIDIVRSAMKVFTELEMIEIYDDSTIFMAEVQKLVGCETKWADKKRRQRVTGDNVLVLSSPRPLDVRQEKELEKELEKEKDNTGEKSPDYQSEFNQLWETYPNKKGKQDALRHYIKARKAGVTPEEVSTGISAYCADIEKSKIEPRYIKHGSTFFHEKAWEDSYDVELKEKLKDTDETDDFLSKYGG